jgi:hypothetical protein
MARSSRFERGFYLSTSAAFLALVVWTFARTYYLKTYFHTPPLTWLLHAHAVVMTGWVVLLVVQSGLVTIRRVAWHRSLGVFGAAWGGLLVLMGAVTTLHAGAREVHAHSRAAAGQLFIMGLDLLQMLFFAAFVALAVVWRRRPDVHKRLMLLTVVCMLPDALARLPVGFMTNGLILVGLDLFLLLSVGIDTLRHRRLHPAFKWGAGAFVVAFHAALIALATHTWMAVATWLVS